MRLLFIMLLSMSLYACGHTSPIIPKFPTPPAELMVKPPALKTL